VRRRRIAKRVLAGVGVLFLATFVAACVSTDRFRSLGGTPNEASLARIHRSPQFHDGEWKNAEPTMLMKVSSWETAKHWWNGNEVREPPCPLPVVRPSLEKPPASGLRITWLGHATTLVEIDGKRILTDPNFSERSSPSTLVGPKRFHPPPIAIADLPKIDTVLLSHEHFDHLDMASIRALAERGTTFHVPLGIGAHLATWGVAEESIVEHDWWEASMIGDVEIVSTPSRHFNGRAPWRTGALWTSWSIVGPTRRVFFSGDTGLTESFREIAEKKGPFDVAMLEIGQYHSDWGDIHLGPRGALEAFAMLRAKYLLPIHWGTFALAYHAWDEPAQTLSEIGGATVLFPRIGQSFEPSVSPPHETWWRELKCYK